MEGVSGKKVVLVGEANPYGTDPRYALYCEPRGSAGGRLCHDILRMTQMEYLRTFERVNLCPQKWSIRVARETAIELRKSNAPLILFGSKVCQAFGIFFEPYTWQTYGHYLSTAPDQIIGVLPHPSGLSRLWNEPGSFDKAKSLIQTVVDRFTAAH